MTQQPTCIACKRSDQQIPLLAMRYNGQELWICPQHLPILIHKPEQLAHKLPGMQVIDEDHPHSHH